MKQNLFLVLAIVFMGLGYPLPPALEFHEAISTSNSLELLDYKESTIIRRLSLEAAKNSKYIGLWVVVVVVFITLLFGLAYWHHQWVAGEESWCLACEHSTWGFTILQTRDSIFSPTLSMTSPDGVAHSINPRIKDPLPFGATALPTTTIGTLSFVDSDPAKQATSAGQDSDFKLAKHHILITITCFGSGCCSSSYGYALLFGP
ncbi:hypothetical protein B0J14DRAFT_564288 [Halenospora varia]|nr:hypothetical protein B0J14DRAFT_564288 [Halenospora varia]